MRLNQYIAKSGIASRRKADILIADGLIKINGKVMTNFGYKINDDDIVTYNNQVLSPSHDIVYLLNNLSRIQVYLLKYNRSYLYAFYYLIKQLH